MVQPASAQTEPECAHLFEDIDFGGAEVVVGALEEMRSFDDSFNDALSSLSVNQGCFCMIFEDNNFQGDSKVFDARDEEIDVSYIGDDWNDRASSVACMRVAEP